MEPLDEPILKSKLLAELTPDKFLQCTQHGGNQIYIFTYKNAPNLMLEVARLRELTYRHAGGGSGKKSDLDHFDIRLNPFKQLIVWNPKKEEIVGGYRFSVCSERISDTLRVPGSPVTEHFIFSRKFIQHFLPFSIELGRAWIQPKYQANGKNGSKSIFALDNLWDGLGALINEHKEVKHLFGKLTIYPTYKPVARNILLWFLNHYFSDSDNLIIPLRPVNSNYRNIDHIPFKGNNLKQDYLLLLKVLKGLKETIPPLISAYMSLSDKIKITGIINNPNFGNVYEIGMFLNIKDIFPEKVQRYLISYHEYASALSA